MENTTKVRHPEAYFAPVFLEENEFFLHVIEDHDPRDHNIISKKHCTRDEDGTWVVSHAHYLGEDVKVSFLPSLPGAILTVYLIEEGDAENSNERDAYTQLNYLRESDVPSWSLNQEELHEIARPLGPKIPMKMEEINLGEVMCGFHQF